MNDLHLERMVAAAPAAGRTLAKPIALSAAVLLACSVGAAAGQVKVATLKPADVKVIDVKAYAYLERAGKLSDNLIGGQALVDAPRGGALGGDTATALLVHVIFQGERNTTAKDASATVDLTQTTRTGQRVLTHKTFDAFAFGDDGLAHKAVFLEASTCMPLTVEVHAGRSVKAARLEAQCEAVPAPK